MAQVCTPLDQTVTVAQNQFCPEGGSTTISIASSETGVNYYLRNNANNAIVAGPIVGTGSGLTFNTGKVTSTTTYNVFAERIRYGALKFTGDTGKEKVSLNTSLYNDSIAGRTQLTIEAWIKRSSLGVLNTIISNYEGGFPLLLRLDNNKLNFYVNSSANVQSTNTIPANVWTHVAATYNGTDLMLYINGVLEGSQPYDQPFVSSLNELKIGGGLSNNTEYFQGDIADVRIWNHARTASQIANNMNQTLTGAENGLIANYLFLEGSGTTASNSAAGNLYPGLLINNPSWATGPTMSNTPICALKMTQLITITVKDVIAPVPDLANLPDIKSECEVSSLTTPTATDNCSGSTSFTILPPASIAGVNSNLGLSNLGPQVFNINAQCVIGYDLTPDSLCCDTIIENYAGKIVVAMRGVCSIKQKIKYIQSAGAIGVIIVNNTGGSAVLDIVDSDPSIVIPSFMVSQNEGLALMKEIKLGTVFATMKRKNPITTTHNANLPITKQGTTVVTWTFDDGNGNTTTQNQNVIIQDLTKPTITCAGNQTEVTNGACDFVLPNYTSLATASDNCTAVPTITQSPAAGTTVYGNTTITLTATDGASNTSLCTFEVVLPSITPIDLTIDQSLTPQLTANQSGAIYQWINCGNGNAPISGATNQSFTATQNGNYAVIISKGGCSDTSACIAISTVGIKEELNTLNSELEILPNPNNGSFTLNAPEGSRITIYNSLGELVYLITNSKEQQQIAMSEFANGIYTVNVINNNKIGFVKFVKN